MKQKTSITWSMEFDQTLPQQAPDTPLGEFGAILEHQSPRLAPLYFSEVEFEKSSVTKPIHETTPLTCS
jgi:hypothetical protein